jgi:hypothetical protein
VCRIEPSDFLQTVTGFRTGPGTIDEPVRFWRPRPRHLAIPGVGRYGVFSQTDTCCLLSLVKGARVQSLQRSRKVIPASRAMRSSSDGQT